MLRFNGKSEKAVPARTGRDGLFHDKTQSPRACHAFGRPFSDGLYVPLRRRTEKIGELGAQAAVDVVHFLQQQHQVFADVARQADRFACRIGAQEKTADAPYAVFTPLAAALAAAP